MRLFASPIYIGLAALLLLLLSLRVNRLRRRHGVVLGDGGREELTRAIRVHANFAEYVPIALLLIVAADIIGYETWVVHGLGIALIVGRVLHAYGLSRDPGESFGRAAGTGLTYAVLLVGGVLAILPFFGIRL